MITTQEIIEKGLKDGREYLYIGGERYRVGDCFLQNGMEITVRNIADGTHFWSDNQQYWSSSNFYDRKCEHCFERNADKKTKDRTPAAVVADNARAECEEFRLSITKNQPQYIYNTYKRIYFYEKMSEYLIKRGQALNMTQSFLKSKQREIETSAALLKINDRLAARDETLLADMYRHSLLTSASMGTSFDIDRFVTGYIKEQSYQQY